MTRILIIILLLGLWLPAGLCLASSKSLEVRTTRIEPSDLNGARHGQLEFLGGFELESRDSRFGGLSGLAMSKDGKQLYAISDRGYWVTARLHHDDKGVLTHIDNWQMDTLLTLSGESLRGSMRDAEALALDRDGSFIVGFERNPRLWRYPRSNKPFSRPPRELSLPSELRGAPSNGGLEALAILKDRSLLLITERYKNEDGTTRGWIMDRKGASPISYRQSDGFEPTDVSTLSNGDIVLLERRYNLLRGAIVRVRQLPARSIRPGASLKGSEIALLEPPFEVDNFEGLAVRSHSKAGTLLYMISDDNYSPLQRTLLLQFRLIKTTP
ncbi:MAG: hypothetical protein GTO40_06550 [Deltaproteobacteria bacterium]|nr:hypothetical protein [Deltaproteobacteria bacterium]